MTDAPIPTRVVEPPAERLRRLSLTPDVPRDDLWSAIAEAVIDINDRMAVLEADAAARRRVIASLDRRAVRPLDRPDPR